MQRFFDVVQDRSGNCIPNALVYVYVGSTSTLATLYSDNGVTTAPNPVTTNSDGEYAFYAANGTYTLNVQATGYESQSRPGTILFDPADAGFVTPPFTIAEGGTGGTTAATARSNLSAAASGANNDITSLTGLTTALSLGQGGTGGTSASTARSSLSAAASGANSDITSLTGLTTALSVAQGGTGGTTVATAATSLQGTGLDSNAVGFRTVPQNIQSISYVTVAADSGKHIFTSTGSITFTIAANSSVAYPIGTAITFVNTNASSITIAINSDVMTLAGGTNTGSRTLAQNGVATALKIGATSWLISGTGLT
jgi:hypothetical protein